LQAHSGLVQTDGLNPFHNIISTARPSPPTDGKHTSPARFHTPGRAAQCRNSRVVSILPCSAAALSLSRCLWLLRAPAGPPSPSPCFSPSLLVREVGRAALGRFSPARQVGGASCSSRLGSMSLLLSQAVVIQSMLSVDKSAGFQQRVLRASTKV